MIWTETNKYLILIWSQTKKMEKLFQYQAGLLLGKSNNFNWYLFEKIQLNDRFVRIICIVVHYNYIWYRLILRVRSGLPLRSKTPYDTTVPLHLDSWSFTFLRCDREGVGTKLIQQCIWITSNALRVVSGIPSLPFPRKEIAGEPVTWKTRGEQYGWIRLAKSLAWFLFDSGFTNYGLKIRLPDEIPERSMFAGYYGQAAGRDEMGWKQVGIHSPVNDEPSLFTIASNPKRDYPDQAGQCRERYFLTSL